MSSINQRHIIVAVAALVLVSPVRHAWAAPFSSPNNLVVMRCTNGFGAEQIFLDEYDVSGAAPVFIQSLELPSDGPEAITMPGLSNHDRHLHRSADGAFLTLAGYGKVYVAGSFDDPSAEPAATTPRVPAIIRADGTFDLSTRLTDAFDYTTFRGAVSSDGTRIWLAGDNASGATTTGGTRYTTKGSSTSVNLSQVTGPGGTKTPDNIRDVGIFDGQLYNCSGSSSSVGKAVFRVGVGLPEAGSQSLTTLTTDNASPSSFAFLDASPDVPGVDTLYSATSTGSSLRKYNLVNNVWTARGLVAGISDFEHVAARLEQGQAIVFAFHNGRIYRMIDTEPYGGMLSGNPGTPYITTASVPEIDAESFTLGGLDFAPGHEPEPTVTLVAASSRRGHGLAGTFDLNLSLTGQPTVEPRQSGAKPQIVFTLSAPPTAGGAAPSCANLVISNGACSAVNVEGNALIVGLSGLAKNTCLTAGVQGIDGLSGNAQVSVVLREGDVNANGSVNILDLQAIKNQLNQPVGAANFRNDVTANGTINILDLQATKNNLNQPAGCP